MFCTNCGNAIKDEHKFCTKCGQSGVHEVKNEMPIKKPIVISDEKWWQRLFKVAYVLIYLPLLIIIPTVWSENSSSYSGYYEGRPHYTYGEAFWYSLLTLIIYLAIIRLIKIAVLYITIGLRPDWKKEFKKVF